MHKYIFICFFNPERFTFLTAKRGERCHADEYQHLYARRKILTSVRMTAGSWGMCHADGYQHLSTIVEIPKPFAVANGMTGYLKLITTSNEKMEKYILISQLVRLINILRYLSRNQVLILN
jgi:hypothetical protein